MQLSANSLLPVGDALIPTGEYSNCSLPRCHREKLITTLETLTFTEMLTQARRKLYLFPLFLPSKEHIFRYKSSGRKQKGNNP